jgi:cobalt-zinc-cadmium efflux system membrane fusion protein
MNKHLIIFSLLLIPTLGFTAELQLTPTQLDNINLTTAKVTVREGISYMKLNGVLTTDQRKTYRVAPVVEGMVMSLKVVTNDKVSKGQVLATLSSSSLGQAQADYLEALARFELAQSERARIKSLWEEGIVAESRWLTVDSEYKGSRAMLEARRRLLSLTGLSKTQIDQLVKQPHRLAAFELTSPIDGQVTGVEIESGQQLSAGQAAFHVDDLSTLWAMVKIPVASLSQIKIGTEAEIRVQASPDTPYLGKLESLGGEVDTQSQTLTGRIILANPDGQLRPGMYAEISLANAASQGLMVPAGSVFRIGNQNYVLQVLEQGRFESVAVEIGSRAGEWVPIISGITANVTIVSSGVAELKSHLQYQGE